MVKQTHDERGWGRMKRKDEGRECVARDMRGRKRGEESVVKVCKRESMWRRGLQGLRKVTK